jgi:hypothetical protein
MQSHGLHILTPSQHVGAILDAIYKASITSEGADSRMYYEQVLVHLQEAELSIPCLQQIALYFKTCPHVDLHQKFDALYVKLVPAPS